MDNKTLPKSFYIETQNNPDIDDYQQITEALPLIVWTATPDGYTDYISPQWADFTGLTPDDDEYLNWVSLLHPEDAEKTVHHWADAIKTGEAFDHKYRFKNKSNEYVWLMARGIPIRNKEGEVTQWYGITHDIHEQMMVEERLRESSQEKDNFIAMLSHELRNPLAAIVNAYEIITNPRLAEQHKDDSLNILGTQIKHLKRLVDDTLDVSRLNSGKFQLIKQNLDLTQLVKESYNSLIHEMNSQYIEHDLVISDTDVWVHGDSVRLSQSIVNIMGNAVKFSQPQDKITVILKVDKGLAQIKIMDTGIGLEEHEVKHLFTPFHQGENVQKESKQGLGLGLAVVHQLVDMHDGKVSAESKGPGKGATFTIELPLIDAEPIKAEIDTQSTHIGNELKKQKLNILLIEDNQSLSRTLKLLIEMEGHQVIVAEDGMAALSCLNNQVPELIISDLTLPGPMNGWQIAERIKKILSEDQLPYMVALSGHAQPDDIQRSMDAGFHKHLAKPINTDELLACMESAYFFKA